MIKLYDDQPARMCSCQDPSCLGPDSKRPQVLHRCPAVLIERDGPFIVAQTYGGRSYNLVPGYQISHPFELGDAGTLEYHADRNRSLHYFVRRPKEEGRAAL